MSERRPRRWIRGAALLAATATALVLVTGAAAPAQADETSDSVVLHVAADEVEGFVAAWQEPVKEAEEAAEATQEAAAKAVSETATGTTQAEATEDAEDVAAASDEPVEAAVAETTETTEAAAEDEPADVWHVSYIPYYGASSAPDDGSVGEWADGYFIAHDWSANGVMIMSCPEYVEVDGVLYEFAGSTTYTRDTYYEDGPEAFAHAGGGIGFQTCYGTVYLVTHYVPC